MDQTVVFKTLSQNDIKRILSLQLNDLQRRLDEQPLKLKVTPTARQLLIDKGYDIEQGARPMRRAIQDLIEDPLATALLDGNISADHNVTITRDGDKLKLSSVPMRFDEIIETASSAE
ncbi:MAG: hypothetical protein ABIS59_00215 [Candidatus Saccharibacteria bacterium]